MSDEFESVGVTKIEDLLGSSKVDLHEIADQLCLEHADEVKLIRAVQRLQRKKRQTPISRYLIDAQMTENESQSIAKHVTLLQGLRQFQQKVEIQKKELEQKKIEAKEKIVEHFANVIQKLNERRDAMLDALENIQFKTFDKCFKKTNMTVEYFEKIKELCEKALKNKKRTSERSELILKITEQAQSHKTILESEIPDPTLVVQFPSFCYQDYGCIHSNDVFDPLQIDIDLHTEENVPISKCVLEWNNVPQATQYIVELQEVDDKENIISINEKICKETYLDLSNLEELEEGCTYKLSVTPATDTIQGIQSFPILFTLPSITSQFVTSYELDPSASNASIKFEEDQTVAYVSKPPGGPIRLDNGVPLNRLMYWEIMILDNYRCGGLYGGICTSELDVNTFGRKIVEQECAWVFGFYSSNFYHSGNEVVEEWSERYRHGDIYGFLLDRIDGTLSMSHRRENGMIHNLQVIFDDLPQDNEQLLYPFVYFGCHTEAKFKYIYYDQIPSNVIRYVRNKYSG